MFPAGLELHATVRIEPLIKSLMDWIRIQQPMDDVQRQGTNPAIEIEQISANKSSTVFCARLDSNLNCEQRRQGMNQWVAF